MIRRLSKVLMMTFFSAGIASAQFTVEPGLSSMYDDNISNNYLQVADRISTLNLDAGYGFGSGAWEGRLFYDGALSYYQNVIERTNQFHSFNLTAEHASGDDDENLLTLGLSVGQGFYRGEYSFYNHLQFSASAVYKQFLTETILNKIGYTFHSLAFNELSEFSYSEHTLMGNLSVALPTQTTVILQADLGGKFYSSANVSTGTQGLRGSMASVAPGVTQLTGMLRLGQSIVEGTGLSLTSKYQWNIQKQTRYLDSSYGLLSDDELFDDHYGYEGFQMSLMLTQVLSESMLLRVTGGFQNRNYSSLAAYDLGGTQLADRRLDRRDQLTVFVQKTFGFGMTLKAAMDIIRNSSNDPFYDYHNSAVSFEVSLPLY